ncbi:MAG: PIG-L deacetylase family protein [Nanobdellota archaeon]
MSSSNTILSIVAHADDSVLGCGGALSKYALEGKEVITIVFSYSERSTPYYRRDVVKKLTIDESTSADAIIGGSGVIFLGLRSGHFSTDSKERDISTTLQELILQYNPEKIFTHAPDDSHPDHRFVNSIVLECYDQLRLDRKIETDVYGFGIWRLFKSKHHLNPRLVIDISSTFQKKMSALDEFKNQKNRLSILKKVNYIKSFIKGLKRGLSRVEEFQKLR